MDQWATWLSLLSKIQGCKGRGRKKVGVGRGRAGQLVKSSGQGRVTVKLKAFSGQGGAVLIIFRAGAAIFPGAVAGRASLI